MNEFYQGEWATDIPDKLRQRIDNELSWYRDGNMDATATAADVIHEVVKAEMPSAIEYFLESAPEIALEAAAEYLEKLKSWNFLIIVDIGPIGEQELKRRKLARQPLYQEVYRIFFSHWHVDRPEGRE